MRAKAREYARNAREAIEAAAREPDPQARQLLEHMAATWAQLAEAAAEHVRQREAGRRRAPPETAAPH
jgi:hypothetical protein